jgi:hypothetical protein
MALTKEFVEAVSQGNLLRVKIMLKDSLLVDTSFNQFNEMLSYAEPRLSGIWVSDDEDDDVFSQSPEELNTILAGLVNNFSKRRVTHLKGMINKLYSSQPKPNQQYRREAVVVIKKTREVVNEYNGIVMDRKKIIEVCARISQNKQMDTKDIELIRTAAISIVNHCDKITRK